MVSNDNTNWLFISYSETHVVTFVYFNKNSNDNQGKIIGKLSKKT